MRSIRDVEQQLRLALNYMNAVDLRALDDHPVLQEWCEIHRVSTRTLYGMILIEAHKEDRDEP